MINKLLQIGKRLLAETDTSHILTLAIDGIIEITGAERGMIILFDENKILFETARNLDKKDLNKPKFEISRTIINEVKTSRKPVCLRNAFEDPVFGKSDSVDRLKILSVICLPLKFEDRIFGVVYLDNRTLLGVFEPETCQLAEDFADFISLAAHHSLERKRLLNRVTSLEMELRSRCQFDEIIGHDPKMVQILKLIDKIANSDVTVLILGETGTGKDLIARAIHDNSKRREKPFFPINCAALPEHLLESELFGYDKGAFTGAAEAKHGLFEVANGGTVFLDEISEMSPNLQAKLLRILQTGEYYRVGSHEIRHCDVRIIVATNKNLKKLVEDGKFRKDLDFRLDVVTFEVPPLRDRRCDILLLIQHFIKKYNEKEGKNVKGFSHDAEAMLLAYDFPGNVRQLENIIQRGIALADTDRIELSDLPDYLTKACDEIISPEKYFSLTEAKHHAAEKAEMQFIINCLKRTSGHISNAAKLAGIDGANFHKLMKKHGIDPNSFKIS